MPDGGPGEGHVDHQQAEEGGTAARGKQCLLLLFNLWNSKKVIQSRNLKSRYGARNRFQEPSLELSSQAT